jgi:hypothetical protein
LEYIGPRERDGEKASGTASSDVGYIPISLSLCNYNRLNLFSFFFIILFLVDIPLPLLLFLGNCKVDDVPTRHF